MITSRLLMLQIVLVVGLATVLLLPRSPKIQPSGVNMELPEFVNDWWGQPGEIAEKERQILGEDTSFARRIYVNGAGDQAMVSVVLSGPEMSRSIHRPERCLEAQGWTNYEHSTQRVLIDDAAHTVLPVTRMMNWRPNRDRQGNELKPPRIQSITYYWFAGLTDLTASHFERMFIDNRDRLFHGYNQRWAYITITVPVTKETRPFGRDVRETDKIAKDLIRAIAPKIHGPQLSKPQA